MNIAFYAGQCLPIHAFVLEERPLGGTETGVVRLAAALQQRGHMVTVFTSHDNPPPSLPRYVPHKHVMSFGSFDVVVVVQHIQALILRFPTSRVFYWTGDSFDQYSNYGLGDQRRVERIEKFLAVSKWHADTLCEQSGFPRSKAAVIGNGLYLPYFVGEEKRTRKRLIFTPSPYRGLKLVPESFKRLKELHPDCELEVFSGLAVYDRNGPFKGPEKLEFDRIAKQLTKLPGVSLRGNVTQRQLSREMMRAGIFFYPSTFFETCCISAMEAQAAGCPVVTSAHSALPETVGEAGVFISGEPGSPQYMERLVQETDRLLSDDEYWQRLSDAGKKRAEHMGWESVADRFEALL